MVYKTKKPTIFIVGNRIYIVYILYIYRLLKKNKIVFIFVYAPDTHKAIPKK